MPRRLRIKFRGVYTLPLAAGSYAISGKTTNLDYRQEQAETARVQLGASETRWNWASMGHRGLAMHWATPTNIPGGTWLDSTGTQNGTSHFITTPQIPAGSVSVTIDISAVAGDLYCKGIEPGSRWGAWTVRIDGVDAEAWWMAPSTENLLNMGSGSSGTNSPFIIKNQNNGTLLTLTWTTPTNAVRTITINHAVGPIINEYPFPPPQALPAPNIYDFEPTDMAALLAWGTAGNSSGVENFGDSAPGNDGGTFGIDPTNGMKYARFRIPKDFRTGISWFKELPGLEEVWTQISAYMEESVWNGIHPNDACKFCGGPSELTPWTQGYEWHIRMHHGGKSQNNPHVFSYEDYFGSDDVTTTTSTLKNVPIRAKRWYCYDVHLKMNTFTGGVANSDGFAHFYVNKNLVGSLTNRRWRGLQFSPLDGHETNIICHWIDFFHGGDDFYPIDDMWYRIGRIRASTTECPIPPEFLTAWPAWRDGLTVGQVTTIAGTAGGGIIPKNSGPLHWNGGAITDDGRLVVCAAGGHNSTAEDDVNGQNKTFMMDFRQDVPAWTILHQGTSTANAPDWNGGDLGGFYATKPYRAHYPADTGDVPIRPSCQTYFNLQYVRGAHCNDGVERVLNIGLRSPRSALGGPNSRRQVDGFKLNAANIPWDEPESDDTLYPFVGNGTKWADIPPRNGQSSSSASESNEPSCCRDPRTGRIYWGADFSLFIMNPNASTNQWSTGITANGVTGIYTHAGSGWSGLQGRAMLVDVNRDRLVIVDPVGTSAARLAWFPLAGGAIQFITISGITVGARTQQHGFVNKEMGFTHDLDNDRYLFLLSSTGASSIDYWYAVDPASGNATLLHESAAGAGGPGRALSSFAYCDELGGVLYWQGGASTTGTQAVDRLIHFLPTRGAP